MLCRSRAFCGALLSRAKAHRSLASSIVKIKPQNSKFFTVRSRLFSSEVNHQAADQTSKPEQNEETSKVKVDPRKDILEASLKHVHTYGWTVNAIAAGAQELGYSSVSHGMFPRGAIELVEYFIGKCNTELPTKLAQMPLQEMRTTKKVREGIKTRLEMQIPYISTWHQAMALGALPQNVCNTTTNIALMVDDIWHYAGDKSTDLNWYSKRALAAAVYASTEVFMLTDKSAGFQDTWDFLDRRLDDVLTFGRVSGRLTDMASTAASLGFSLVSSVGSQIFSRSK
eukprot:TRINITY_DN4493_c0_g1_i1.p1 TRINITY_DN4493_c0_g1~~TRINITY_DN4493_c0_g1_i1.p1  ORF type:complete len:284 (+),score=59.91 TRINITY_DN4493_c0_g1_i1:40-891(+)